MICRNSISAERSPYRDPRKLRKEKQYDEAMKTLTTIAKNNSLAAFKKIKKYYLEQVGM